MKTLLILTIIGTVMIAVGLLGLYAIVIRRIRNIEKSLNLSKQDIRRNHNDIKILKQRDADASDRIIIEHQYPSADISFPSKEV